MVRLAVSTIGGVAIALALFLLMHSLIGADQTRVAASADNTIVDFVRLNEITEVQTKQRKRPKKPAPVKRRPPTPKMTVTQADRPRAERVSVVTPNIKVPVSAGSGPYLGGYKQGQMSTEGDVIPILRVAPRYPRAARMRGTEGWVTVHFTIEEDGTVSAPSVIDSKPRRVFDDAAVRAIRRWKFKPRIVDGVPTKRGAEQTITFKMDEL